ncbi:hypothetical protein DPMN_017421 [Dreissena polymorpha]|uniref:Uncharacterized protein n=1 Tax=Dreissena polymorpha TaxID=45954 RepID=A0A9D4NF67_DREPO|nr:hypothetical protein DPMN_017421 [Dreissena polymorpha]
MFLAVFSDTWKQVDTFQNDANGFQRYGLFPFTADGIDETKSGPSALAPSENSTHVSNGIVADRSVIAVQLEVYHNTEANVDNVLVTIAREDCHKTRPLVSAAFHLLTLSAAIG